MLTLLWITLSLICIVGFVAGIMPFIYLFERDYYPMYCDWVEKKFEKRR